MPSIWQHVLALYNLLPISILHSYWRPLLDTHSFYLTVTSYIKVSHFISILYYRISQSDFLMKWSLFLERDSSQNEFGIRTFTIRVV